MGRFLKKFRFSMICPFLVVSVQPNLHCFELGYFIGKLNPNQVCLLYKEGVELPSDIRDVAYVPMDRNNNWQLKLSQGMQDAGLPVDMKG